MKERTPEFLFDIILIYSICNSIYYSYKLGQYVRKNTY